MSRKIVIPFDGDLTALEKKTKTYFADLANSINAVNSRRSLKSTPIIDVDEIKRQLGQVKDLTTREASFYRVLYSGMVKESQIAAIGQIQAEKLRAQSIENSRKREYAEFVRLEREKSKVAQQNSFGKDFLNQTALGSFIGSSTGAIAGQVFSKAVSLAASLGSELVELGKDALQAGSEFEKTVNSVSIFAGGASNANRELGALRETVQNTAGLRLIPAEEGYKNLRALGFEAENSRKLIAGLGKERLLSGATEQDVQRVIVNLTQLSAGSNRASADLREIFHSMPALRKEFALAFGSLDPKKISKAFGDDPQNAIKKLTEQFEKSKGAAGGLDDAYGKLNDEFIIFGREASKEVIPELTEDLKTFTNYMREGSAAFGVFGVRLANIYEAARRSRSVFDAIPNFAKISNISDEESIQLNRARKVGAISFDDYVKQQTGKTLDDLRRYQFNLNNVLFGGRDETIDSKRQRMNLNIGYNTLLNQKENDALKPERESAFQQAQVDAQIAVQNALEKARSEQLGKLDSYYSQVESVRKSAFQIEEAQNENNLSRILQLHQTDFAQQIKDTTAFYKEKIALTDGSDIETYKLEIERNNKLREIQTNAQIDQLKLQKQIEQQRRESSLEFFNLEKTGIEQILGRRIELTQRAIDRETVSYKDGYNTIIGLTKSQENSLSGIIKAQYDLRLQDKSLTDAQIFNLTKQRDLELQKIAQDTSDRILQIQDQQYQNQIAQIEKFSQRQQEKYKQTGELLNQTLSIFSPQGNSSQATNNLGDAFFGGDYDVMLADVKKQIDDLTKYRSQLFQQIPQAQNIDKLRFEYDSAGQAIEDLQPKLKILENRYSSLSIELFHYSKNLSSGKASIEDFDKAQRRLLQGTQALELAGINTQLNEVREKIEKAATSGTKADREKYEFQESQLVDQKVLLQLKQATDLQNQYNDSLEGLREQLGKLKNNDPATILGLQYLNEKSALTEQIGLYQDIFALKAKIANTDNLGALSSQRKELEFIAQNTKSAAESFSDFRISVADSFLKQIDSPFEKLNQRLEKLPPLIRGISSAFLNLANDMIRAFSQKLIMRLLGLGNSTQSNAAQSGGNWFQKAIGSIFSGGQPGVSFGNGSTPGFNPSSFTGAETFTNTGVTRLPDGSNATNVFGGLPVSLPSDMPGISSQFVGRDGKIHNAGGGFKLNGSGGIAIASMAASLIGGAIGGRVGNTISMAGTGAGIGLMFGGPIGAAIGAAAGGLFGFLMGDPKRKADAKQNLPQLQKNFADAFTEFNALIADVSALRTDADGALSKGRELRQSIASGFGIQFQSKKYQKQSQQLIAQQLAQIDSHPSGLMDQLTKAVERAKSANAIERAIIPEFADGGMVSNFFKTHFSGLVPGIYDRKDDKLIKVTGNEVVLTPNHWQPIAPYLAAAKVPGFADGGMITPTHLPAISSDINIKVELHNVDVKENSYMVLESADGKRKVIDIYKEARRNKEI